MTKKYQRLGVVGRFKPLHLGGAVMLESLCENAEHVVIGIGSSNKYKMRNPFTAQETQEMVDAYLNQHFENYEFIHVPDFAQEKEFSDGQKWRSYITKHCGELDAFVSGNEWTRHLLGNDYTLIDPSNLIPRKKWVCLRATKVRMEMAFNRGWEKNVPESVARYIKKNGLDQRFRNEFGLGTIASLVHGSNYERNETFEEEQKHTREE